MKWFIRLAVVVITVIGTAFVGAVAAHAATIPVQSTCDNGWYVNGDEGDLMPDQVQAGLVFDGPSLVHHAITAPPTLATTPTDGAFTTTGAITGVKPLFKMETATPYSTINKTTAGKYWSSKIPTGPGSQSSPVDSPADLAVLAPYTADTRVYSFGVGYANDTGNKATVTSVTFGGHVYTMACAPSPSPSQSPSASHTTATPSTSTPGVPTLPVTGSAIPAIIAGGVALIVLGLVGLLVGRRRRFEA